MKLGPGADRSAYKESFRRYTLLKTTEEFSLLNMNV